MVKHFYEGMDEFRWEFPHIGQGHYILAKDMDEAAMSAVAEARKLGLGKEIILQKWKPTRGKKYRLLVQAWKPGWR